MASRTYGHNHSWREGNPSSSQIFDLVMNQRLVRSFEATTVHVIWPVVRGLGALWDLNFQDNQPITCTVVRDRIDTQPRNGRTDFLPNTLLNRLSSYAFRVESIYSLGFPLLLCDTDENDPTIGVGEGSNIISQIVLELLKILRTTRLELEMQIFASTLPY